MKFFITIAAICSLFGSSLGLDSDKWVPALNAARGVCLGKIQVNKAMLDRVRAGDWSVQDQKLKDYAFCIYKTLDLIDDSGNLKMSVIKTLVPEGSDAKFTKALETCKSQTGSTPSEKSWNTIKCLHQEYPDDEVDL